MRLLRHPNIVAVKDVMIPQRQKAFDDIFIVTELLDTDLAHLIKSKTKYDDIHTRWLIFQLLRGLKHIHAANVFHRDLKPGNLLLNANCDLKICDFGLARANFAEETADTPVFWTDYVATRWYRAPELICSYFTRYSAAVDMWAVGCIFGELMKRKALFPGHNVYHQIDLISDFVGTPASHTISKVRNHKARDYLASLPQKLRADWGSMMPMLDATGIDLMSKMLAFDPDERISAEAALDHPYFAAFHNTLDESLIPPPPLMLQEEFAWENEKKLTVADLRATLYGEICRYHPELTGPEGGQVGDEQRALGRTNSTYGENGTACADVKSQMQQIARGDAPSSRAASMPAPVTAALVAQAAASAAAPPVGRSGEEQSAYSMYAEYSHSEGDMAMEDDDDDLPVDLVDAEPVDFPTPEEDLYERKAESLSADDIRKMAEKVAVTPEGRAYNAARTRHVSVSPSPLQELKKFRRSTQGKSAAVVRPPPPPLPAATSKAHVARTLPMGVPPSADLQRKLQRSAGDEAAASEVGSEDSCAIM